LKPAKKQAPLTQWMKGVSAYLKSHEMDNVFYAVKSNQEVDLLNKNKELADYRLFNLSHRGL